MLLPAFHIYVEQGILDTAFVESAELINRKQLDSLTLFSGTACFAVAPFHPLAAFSSVTADMLAMDYKIAWNVEKDNPAVRLFPDEVRKTTWPCVRILTDR